MTTPQNTDFGEIINRVDRSLKRLVDEFQAHPLRFFTEHDLASRAYGLMREQFQELALADGVDPLSLVHHEYPTPFKCDMKNGRFVIRDDKTRHHRGHYDIIILNPTYVKSWQRRALYGQEFSVFRDQWVKNEIDEPMVIFGIEMMFNRQVNRSNSWWDKVDQDFLKLAYSIHIAERPPFLEEKASPTHAQIDGRGKWFMNDIRVLAFDLSTKDDMPPCLRKSNKVLHIRAHR